MVILILPLPPMPHWKDGVHARMVWNPPAATGGLLKKLLNVNKLNALN